jgi:uncharacterized protein YecT (DUF1311 family)
MTKLARLCLLSAMIVACLSGGAFSQTQRASNEDACAGFKQADALLNKNYNQILKQYKNDAAFLRKLRIAQRAWVAYRNAQVEALYPEPDKRTAYGSIYPTCRCVALAKVTTLRAEDLRKWIDGAEEGDTCSGSIKGKS